MSDNEEKQENQEENQHVKNIDDYDYFAGRNVFVEADDDSFIVKAPVDGFHVVNEDGSNDYKIATASSLLKAMFRKFFDPHVLEDEDFFVHVEVHKNNFKQEYRDIIEEAGNPVLVEIEEEDDYKNDAQKRNDPKRFRPEIEIKDEELKEEMDDDLVEQLERKKEEDQEFIDKMGDKSQGGEKE